MPITRAARANRANRTLLLNKIEFAFGSVVSEFLFPIDLYHAMLKQKILPVQPLIQCEAGRAKTKLFVPLGLKMAAA